MENLETKLQELEAQKQLLLAEQAKIEAEAKYYLLIEARDKYFETEIAKVNQINTNIQMTFNTFKSAGLEKHITIENYERTIKYSSYYDEKLKPADQNKSVVVNVKSLKSKWGMIGVENDRRISLPSSVTSRYQAYKIESAIKKIKAKITSEIIENNNLNKLETAKTELITMFQTQYPGCTVEYANEYVYNHYMGSRGKGYYTNTLKITFTNTSWIKISFNNDKSYIIKEKYDHRNPQTKEEWFEYLSK